MTSRDGRNWKRPIRELFLADGPQDSWRDKVFKIFANPPIERDGKLWIYYGGKTGTVSVEEGYEPFQALCLAQMRRDGFVSLDADGGGGLLTTKRLVVRGDQLRLNVVVRNGGHAAATCRFRPWNGAGFRIRRWNRGPWGRQARR